jgi:hypothetical protein
MPVRPVSRLQTIQRITSQAGKADVTASKTIPTSTKTGIIESDVRDVPTKSAKMHAARIIAPRIKDVKLIFTRMKNGRD